MLGVWVAGRAAFWESPLVGPDGDPSAKLVGTSASQPGSTRPGPEQGGTERAGQARRAPPMDGRGLAAQDAARDAARDAAKKETSASFDPFAPGHRAVRGRGGRRPAQSPSGSWLAHQHLFAAAMRATFTPAAFARPVARADSDPPPFAPPGSAQATSPAGLPSTERSRASAAPSGPRPDRWSLDAWAFWREGSASAPVSQGRVPIYGASQIGANLQWRARPSSPHDPRAYARAYRALVEGGESELALGVSARPLPRLPVRVGAEMRAIDGPFATELRPGVLAVTEFAPVRLPYDLALEAYAQGGYVGGEAATAFADGQIAVTRQVARFGSGPAGPMRLSIGAGAWGGAQQGSRRVDIGPTMRLDLNVGEVPARVSVDWRERVGGDAAPASGVAATLSTRF
ncbi:MAG: hypothetical protein RIB52_13090 [Erythrobacter sp.]|uniref:hypothetical protein n=1 Tax=Erythrobacter sp. TaxID=1042 RepID=UPI0032EDDED0